MPSGPTGTAATNPGAQLLPTEIDPVKTVRADCLDVLRKLPADTFDAVVADPPYGIDYQCAHKAKDKRFDKIANDGQPFVWWLWDAARVLKPGGCLLCFCRWDSAEAFRLAIEWAGLVGQTQLVWDRVVHGMGDLTGSPAPQHDTIWFAAKGKYKLPGSRPTSVYRSQRLGGTELLHPNQKPEPLIRALIRDFVPAGGTIFDPFSGCGTVAVCSVYESRRCLATEVDPGYAATSERLVREAKFKHSLRAAKPQT